MARARNVARTASPSSAAASVADVALLLGVISRLDARDYTSLPWDDCDCLDGIDAGVRGLRIGLLADMGFGLLVQPAAAGVFASLGAIVTPMPAIFDADPELDFDQMMQAYGWADFGALPPERQALVLPEVADWCRRGERVSATDLTRAAIGIGQTRRRVIAACAPYDYLISPTMAVEPYAAERPWPEGGTQHNPFCFPFNLSEQPALSLCCGFTQGGLPVGLQIIGKRFDDAGVLRVARAFEAERPAWPAVLWRDAAAATVR